MEALRTPDDRFDQLPGWAWQSRYAPVTAGDAQLRMAYVDEGPPAARCVLLLHGEPTWSYLYRHMIGPLTALGLRVIAPDLIGFGRSDKPVRLEDYSYAQHLVWLSELVIERLDLRDAVLFCQDWGGLLGLRLVAANPERFAAVIASNTMLPTGDHDPGPAFRAWRDYSQSVEQLPIGRIVAGAARRELAPDEIAGYDAPFPDERFKAGARRFPALVPITPDDPEAGRNRAAWKVLSGWKKPFVCAFGDSDPITAGGDGVLRKLIPGTVDQPHVTLSGVGHFSQEDAAEQLVDLIGSVAQRLDTEAPRRSELDVSFADEGGGG